MNRHLQWLAAFSIASLVVGNAYAESPADHMKKLEPFIGEWVYIGPVQEDLSIAGKGGQVIAHNRFRWAIGKSAVVLEWSFRPEGQEAELGIELLGWDRKAKAIRSIMQTKSGAQDSGAWSFDGTTLKWSGSGLDAEGDETSGTVHMKLIGKDTFTWQLVDRRKAGKQMPDTGVYTFKRMR